jgi:alpha-amylase
MVPPVRRRLSRAAALAGTALVSTTVLVAAGLAPTAAGAAPATPAAPPSRAALQARAGAADAPSLRSASPGVMANLFEWNWDSVASECTDVLGPAGFGGVQVAPPQDSLKRSAADQADPSTGAVTVRHPWWEVYQPVDYALTSRMGDEAQFTAMVTACRSAGVKVYVDTVINHGVGQGHTSYGGQTYDTPDPYDQPAVPWTKANFHVPQGECPTADGGIADFNNVRQVTRCNLSGLHDLRTETPYVRGKITGYLNRLIGLGVSGFRVDAAKHIAQADLDAIRDGLHKTKDGTEPYWALEVFGGGPGSLSPQAFTRHGTVLGLDGVKQIRDAFHSYAPDHVGSIATLKDFGAGSGLTPSSRTLSFVQNHDTERNGDALSYKVGQRSTLATEWLLASGYGTPQVYAGFTFDAPDPATLPSNATADDKSGNAASPPSDAEGMITDTDCTPGRGWTCTDRVPGVLAMVGWHNYVGRGERHRWYDDGENVIAFNRGNRGWVAFNNNLSDARTITVKTGMKAGTYCDTLHGGVRSGRCSGPTVRVRSGGRATVTIKPLDAVAFTRLDRV